MYADHTSFDVFYRVPSYWAVDSEFLASGRADAPEDVHSVQFSNGDPETTVVLESADSLKEWLYNHDHIKTMFAFVALPDLASIEEWLGAKSVTYRFRGTQLIGKIRYRRTDITVFDTRPLLQSFGIRKLDDGGKLVGFSKLTKPEWLGLRRWQTQQEREAFIEYAAADAIITSRIVKWLYDNFGADPTVHASAGGLARDEFALPKRLHRVKKTVVLPALERMVKKACYAGRSEGFTVGYTPHVVYNDVRSLYPCSVVAARVLEITDAVKCNPTDIVVTDDLNETRYGWLDGTFNVPNSRWDGLPLRGVNNFYATGVISGFYHTFDLAASHAEVLHVAHAYRPVFKHSDAHLKFADLLLKRLERRLDKTESMLAKAMLNALSGKLGQSHPLSRTSNFFAYSTVLAHSHAVMSRLFDRCASKILAMDTDSIFSQSDMTGKHFELTDGEHAIPVDVDVKGKGDLSFFRSKNYILRPHDGSEPVVGRHHWFYFYEDYLKLFDGSVEELCTRQDIKHTLLTRQKEAQKLAIGRWKTKPVKLDLAKIKVLLSADLKRQRETYDSYGLVMRKQSVDSQAWRYEDLLGMRNENPLNFPTI